MKLFYNNRYYGYSIHKYIENGIIKHPKEGIIFIKAN